MKRPLAIGLLCFTAIAVWAASSSLFVVTEATQALIVRLGRPVEVIDKPGLRTKLPFVDNVIAFDTRLLLLEPPAVQVILGDQKRIEVQTYARFRIADPLPFAPSNKRAPNWSRWSLPRFVANSGKLGCRRSCRASAWRS